MSFDFKKAGQSFDKLSFKKRMTSVYHLFSNTISVIGRDKDIIKPFIRMVIYNLVMITSFFYVVFSYWYNLPLVFLSGIIAFSLFLYKYFYYSRQEIRMSWIIYDSITGGLPTYKDSVTASKTLKSQIRKIGWIDIGMAIANNSQKNKSQGGGSLIIKLVLKGMNEVWDLINHYLIPSVAVDKMDIKPAIQSMKSLKERVPESLVGVFGIDFLGKVVRSVIVPVYLILIVCSLAMGLFLSGYLPSTEFNFSGSDLPFELITISWIPLVGAFYLGKLFSSIFERLVTMVKVVYFTIFYTQITHPEKIAEDLREQLVDYLKLDHVNEVHNLDVQDNN